MNLSYRFLIAFVVLLLIILSGFVQVKNGQNSTRIKSVEENDLRLNLDGEGTDSFLLQNYKPILKTRGWVPKFGTGLIYQIGHI